MPDMHRDEEAVTKSQRGRQMDNDDAVEAGQSDSQMDRGQDISVPQIPAMIASLESPGRPNLRRSTTNISEVERRIAALRASQASYFPTVPSPLNPSSMRSSSDSSDGREVTGADVLTGSNSVLEEASSGQERSSSDGRSARSRGGSGALSGPQQLLRKKSASAIFSGTSSGQGIPKHLKDLGRDYSRYPPSRIDLRPNSRPPGSRSRFETTNTSSSSLLRTTTRNPFTDSEADIEKWGYPDDSVGAFDPYYGGEKGFILFTNEKEADDDIHMPMDDDDKTFKPRLSEYMERRSLVSAVGGIFLILGLLCVFVVLPVLTYTTRITLPGARQEVAGDPDDSGPAWAHVNNNTYPILKNVRKDLIDDDTPESAYTRKSTFDSSVLKLVFSDEFNKPNRTFYHGDDPFWSAGDLWYGATQDMEWYDPDAVTTGNGTLQLRLDSFPNHGLQFRSGMLGSWNHLCFKGGVFEVSVSLAGPSGVPGLWPGAWSMGNLGRPGYKATTEGVWPYTYNSCDVGITPNQSSPDGLSRLPGQKLSSCTCEGADHPSPGTGRGAPEIDILEGSVDPNNRIGVITQSFQVAPFDVWYRPNSDFLQIPNYETTQMNGYCGGPFQQAISGTTLLNNNWYDGKEYQKYAFEYIPGTSEGKIAWFVGEDQSFMMDGRAIGPNGNVAARQVSEEPMSMILNLGISGAWSEILMDQLKFPTVMHVDYVRIYQKAGEEMITCDPPGYPTTEYIKNHPKAYNNANLTEWDQTGYGWPKHTLTGC